MANDINDLTAKLKVTLDKSSVDKVQKELSKKDFKIKTKVQIEDDAAIQSLNRITKGLSSFLSTAKMMENFISSLRQSVTELKEIDTYLNKIDSSKITLPKVESTKTETTGSSSLNSILDKINSFNKLISTGKLLAAGLKDIGSPKTPGLIIVSICR